MSGANQRAGAFTAAVLTISDRCARHQQPDSSGGRIVARLAALPATIAGRRIVPDESAQIAVAVAALTEISDLLITTGGTGLARRDVTPDAIHPLLDREIPGMGEAMRARGVMSTPLAMLSREFAGVRGCCLVLALPGSPRAVDECLDAVWDVLPHALDVISGRDRSHPRPAG